MRQLHVVALSEDGRSVLLAASKSAKTGTFSVPLEGRLSAAVRGELPRAGEREVREMGVSPKEIQARLRAGESPEQIADAAGVPVARVERFAGPVLSERERIIDEARAAYLSRSRRGASQLPLGDAVDAALAETASLRPETVAWTARRLDSGHWLVQVSYVARARTRTASWVYEPQTRAVTASDPASGALGHVGEEPAPRRVPAPRTVAATTARPAKKATARKKTAAKPAAKKVAAKPAAKKAAPAKAAPVKKAAAKKAAAKKAPAKKAAAAKAAPVTKAASKKTPPKKVAAKKVAARKVAAPPRRAVAAKPAPKPAPKKKATRRAPVRTLRHSAAAEELASTPAVDWDLPPELAGPPTLRVVPHPDVPAFVEPEPEPTPEPTVEEPPAAAAPKRRAAGERAHVPDWADVLLGATPKRSDD